MLYEFSHVCSPLPETQCERHRWISFQADKISDSINSILQHPVTHTHHPPHVPCFKVCLRALHDHFKPNYCRAVWWSPVLLNHICIEWPKAEEVQLDRQPAPSEPCTFETTISHIYMVLKVTEHPFLLFFPLSQTLPMFEHFTPEDFHRLFLTPDSLP